MASEIMEPPVITNPYTKDQVDNRFTDYVCYDCGVNFLTPGQHLQEGTVSTFHTAQCGLCLETKGITHIRNYNWLRL